MEYFPHGDLHGYITNELTEEDAKLITRQLLEGLSIMHENHFTHRDLKPQVSFPYQPEAWTSLRRLRTNTVYCLLEYLRRRQIT